MNRRHLAFWGLAAAAALILAGCSFGSKSTNLRPTNAEVRIISQSSFQGEIQPCG
ncbi:MAG: hypothetical protein GF330_07435 [Candidatus Eisenbacteria bacterium]|nr:hypothetical protein [Candidatus Eisenbacteria bacterium]